MTPTPKASNDERIDRATITTALDIATLVSSDTWRFADRSPHRARELVIVIDEPHHFAWVSFSNALFRANLAWAFLAWPGHHDWPHHVAVRRSANMWMATSPLTASTPTSTPTHYQGVPIPDHIRAYWTEPFLSVQYWREGVTAAITSSRQET